MNFETRKPDAVRQDKIEGIHKLPLYGALSVAVLTLVVVVGAQLTGAGKVSRSVGTAVQERTLLFRDAANGNVVVRDASTKAILASYDRGEGAFIRQSMRAMSHNRIQQKLEKGQPYRLVKTSSGKLSIVDPITGKFIKLNAFGKVAMTGFLALLNHPAQSANATTISEKGA